MVSKFNLKDWDQRVPINSDITKPWGEYHVFQDFSVSESNPLPENILKSVHSRFQELLNSDTNLKENITVNKLTDDNNKLFNEASADEKILVVQPKQENYQILSMQYHGREGMSGHIEVWEFLTEGSVVIGSDRFMPYGWNDEESREEMKNLKVQKFKAGEILVILPGQWHALAKPKNVEYTVVREWRITPEPNRTSKDREENIVRTYDNSGRGTLGNFPEEIMEII